MLPKTIKVIIRALQKRQVAFVMFGMEALNLYARGPDETFSTQDTDLLIGRSISVIDILAALRAVKKWPEPIHIVHHTANQAPVTIYDGVQWNLRKIQSHHDGTVTVYTPGGLYHVDLAFGHCGIPFEELWNKSNRATYLGAVIRVARKEDILESKRRAGREKDVAFLERLRAGERDAARERTMMKRSVKGRRSKRKN